MAIKPKVDNAMDSTQAARYRGKAHVAARITPVAVGLGSRSRSYLYMVPWTTVLGHAPQTGSPYGSADFAGYVRVPKPQTVADTTERAIRYDTIRDAILTCARKPTSVSLIYCTEPTTKKYKNRKSKKTDMLRSNSKQSGKSI